MQTAMVRRVLGDAVGFLTLAILVGLLVYAWPGATTPSKLKELFPPIYILLIIPSYACWITKDRKAPNSSWLIGAMWSIFAAILSLAGDILIGYLANPSTSLLKAPLSAGIPVAVTLFLCPGFTCTAISGWARSWVIPFRPETESTPFRQLRGRNS